MEYRAIEKYIRTSPRKLRLVVKGVKKLRPAEALDVLARMPHQAAKPAHAALASAMANARVKQAKQEELRIASFEVTEGPVMKRWRAVSRGMAHEYKKRMSHIRVILTDQKEKE